MIKLHMLYDAEGNWKGPEDHMVTVGGEKMHIEEYAKKHNIELPEAKKSKKTKKPVNTDIEDKHADMGQSQDEGHSEVD